MAYRVEYNGEDIQLATLDAALDCARTAIANDVDRLDGWAVEHDEDEDDWYVQAVRNGRRFGPTAVITAVARTAGNVVARPAGNVAARPAGNIAEDWERRVSFVGRTPAEAFALAAEWLERRPDIEVLGDVGWHHTSSGHQLRIYYRA